MYVAKKQGLTPGLTGQINDKFWLGCAGLYKLVIGRLKLLTKYLKITFGLPTYSNFISFHRLQYYYVCRAAAGNIKLLHSHD